MFSKFGVRLEFTDPALYQIAKVCHDKGIGARGLGAVMDKLLVDSNYDSPASGTSFVLVTEEVVKTMDQRGEGKIAPWYYSRYEMVEFLDMIESEDPELAYKLNRELYGFQHGADQDGVVKKPRRKISASG